MGEEIIQLELNVNEINVILRSLGKHPFEEIAQLIAKIKDQGEARLKELQAATQAQAELVDTAESPAPAAETPAVEG